MKKSRVSDPIELMTLGNMRENGVRSLAAEREALHHGWGGRKGDARRTPGAAD
jgi:hypothetical protein